MFSDIFSVCLSIEFSFIWQICIVLFCDSHSSSRKEPPYLKITFRCFNLVLYKIRKTFRYAFLGSCCRFLRILLQFSSDALSFSPFFAVFVLCFCTKSVRLLGMLFSDFAVVFSGYCCSSLRMRCRFLRFLLFLFYAFIQNP